MASLFQAEPHPLVVSWRAAWAGCATAPLGFLGLLGLWMNLKGGGNRGRKGDRGSGWWVGPVRTMGACLRSQLGNIRVRSWQPLSLFIVYCLPTPRTVNNGTPTPWAICVGCWRWSSQPFLFQHTTGPLWTDIKSHLLSFPLSYFA